jgi:hypothetical protein
LDQADASARIRRLLGAPERGFELLETVAGSYSVSRPIFGAVRVDSQEVSMVFEAPMWVPSQRLEFESNLAEALTGALSKESQ